MVEAVGGGSHLDERGWPHRSRGDFVGLGKEWRCVVSTTDRWEWEWEWGEREM